MFSKVLFIIDELEFKYFEFNKLITNFWLIREFLKNKFKVFITTKNNLFLNNYVASAIVFESFTNNDFSNIYYEKASKIINLNDFNTIFFRPDPPVDIDYINACSIFEFVDQEKTLLINNPISIKNFNEKLHINLFPQAAPKNIITSSANEIKNFLEEEPEAILKPLNMCFGNGVFFLNKNDKNINTIIKNATNNETRLVMVQKYLNKGIHGDKRVLIINNKVLDESVIKLPGENDFKFNTHSDNFFAKAVLSKTEKQLAQEIADDLSKKELYLVGLDMIDEKVIEINVTSPCYFIKEINQFYNINFENIIINELLNLINNHSNKIVKFY